MGGWGQLYPNFFWIFGFFYIYKVPNAADTTSSVGSCGNINTGEIGDSARFGPLQGEVKDQISPRARPSQTLINYTAAAHHSPSSSPHLALFLPAAAIFTSPPVQRCGAARCMSGVTCLDLSVRVVHSITIGQRSSRIDLGHLRHSFVSYALRANPALDHTCQPGENFSRDKRRSAERSEVNFGRGIGGPPPEI